MFKHTAMLIAISLTTAAAVPAQAMETQHKQDLTAIGTLAVATAAAGPVGFLVGAVAADWLVGQVADADRLADTREELAALNTQLDTTISALKQQEQLLAVAHREQARYARLALEQLKLDMLFKTGESTLTRRGRERLTLLAEFLLEHSDLTVQIAGFADPRGSAQANLALSRARAEQVASALESFGVADQRLQVVAHGEAHSLAPEGDLEAYAFERRVRIELLREGSGPQVAGVDVVQ